MVPIMRLAMPSLVMVTVLGKLDEPDWIEPKSRLAGLTEISASLSGVPVPDSDTEVGFSSGSLEGMDKVADLAPIAVGLKETETLAEVPEASV